MSLENVASVVWTVIGVCVAASAVVLWATGGLR